MIEPNVASARGDRACAPAHPVQPTSDGDATKLRMARKVLFVESGLGNGGSAFSLFRLVKSLDRTRYEPHVLVFHDAQPFEQIRSLDVPVKVIRAFRPLRERSLDERKFSTRAKNYCSVYGNFVADSLYNGIRIANYIRHNDIHIVHLNNALLENFAAAFAAHLTRIPCVMHVRGTESLMKVEKYFLHWVSAVITLNRTMLEHYGKMCGGQRVHMICNGVDLDAFQQPNSQKTRLEFNIEPGACAIGTFSRLVEGKGVPEFLAMAAQVSRERRQSRFFIVGHDPTKDRAFEARMKRLAVESGLRDQLVFTGWRDDRIDIMAAMDVVVQISTTYPEGMSLAPLEAMALGKPVIVTKIPGYEFCVDDGKTGFMVEPGDIQVLTEKVLMLARDEDLARRMGEEGYRKAQQQFDVRLTARRVQHVYDQVLNPHKSSQTRN